MKFAMAQEISQHVRNKLCKFFNMNKTEHSTTTCTITSNEAEIVGAENAEPLTFQTSTKSFTLITPDSIKHPSVENDKVSESPTEGLDLLDSNFTDVLLPNAFQISSNSDGKEFGTIVGEIDNHDQQVVEILFSCKICNFR